MAFKPVGVDENGKFPPRVEAALDSTYATPGANSVALLGHSFLASSRPGLYNTAWNTPANLDAEPFGYYEWAEIALGGRLRLIFNGGIGGQTTSQIYARIAADVLGKAEKPRMVIFHGVRNDINTAVPTATITANLKLIFDKLRANGIQVFAVLEIASTEDDAAKLSALDTVNRWTTDYAARNTGIQIVDFRPAVTIPATGLPNAGYLKDAIHFNKVGASRAGAVLASVMAPFVNGTRNLAHSNADSSNLGVNPLMVGTAGGKDTGVTGSVADGWTVSWNGTPGAVVASKVARTDGLEGEWQQVVINTAPSGYTRLDYTGYTGSLGTLWTSADSYYVEAEYEIDGDISGITRFMIMSYLAGSSTNASALGSFSSPVTMNPGLVMPRAGVLRSPVAKFEAGTNAIGIGVQIGGGVGATVRFSKLAVRKAFADMLP